LIIIRIGIQFTLFTFSETRWEIYITLHTIRSNWMHILANVYTATLITQSAQIMKPHSYISTL